MRALLASALYRLIRYEPHVPSVPSVFLVGCLPALNICLILVRYTDSQLVKVHVAILCKVKDVFMTVIDEPITHYWLEVAACNIRVVTDFSLIYCYRFDPVDDVL